MHTTSYHPSANGMVDRLHRQLKASIMAQDGRLQWVDHLPFVLLGTRSAFKTDLKCTSAELVYGSPLRLPGEFFDTSEDIVPQPQYLDDLRRSIQELQPTPPRFPSSRKVFVSQELTTCTHAFVRKDVKKGSLIPLYDGPFKIIDRTDNTIT